MNTNYFKSLNQVLRSYKRAIPSLVLDLDRLDENLYTLKDSIPEGKSFRIVVKSLPSISLLDHVMEKMGTNKLMIFHQPFLTQIAKHYGKKVDILMGKPMPVQTVRYVYQSLEKDTAFEAVKQLQWLIDTQDRLVQYLALAKELDQKLLINLEIDVGLHRGGFSTIEELKPVLQCIAENKDQLIFSGFMGYDPHVAMLPKALRSSKRSFQLANDFYKKCVEIVRTEFQSLWREDLTLNGAGSPTLAFHRDEDSVLNDVSAGSALVKPTHFDTSTLSEYVPACFIATPILKKFDGTTLPVLEKLKGLLNILKPAFKRSYFIYGGYWKADYHYPPKTTVNSIFGPSTNQSMINTASGEDLDVDDFVFLRPSQSEFVFLQFGDILVYKDGEIVEEWPVLENA